MLQQTRVAAAIPYYERFLARFPDVAALAAASEQDVLACWSGLGYYSRARSLHRAARLVAAAGRFPTDWDGLRALPGIGGYTASAISSIAFGLPQYLPHPLKPLGDAKPGWMCERVNMTDWEGPEKVGETHKMTTWAETSLMLTTIEIPGLYVQPDKSLVVAFDNILAEVVSDLHAAGDSIKFIAKIYGITVHQVNDAIEYAKKAA